MRVGGVAAASGKKKAEVRGGLTMTPAPNNKKEQIKRIDLQRGSQSKTPSVSVHKGGFGSKFSANNNT